MGKLNSFAEFSAEKSNRAAAALEEEQDIKRSGEANSFKSLLTEFGVSGIKELSEEQRSDFFNKLRNLGVNESNSLITEGTRSQIGVISKSGKITSTYVHHDGYPEHMLPMLNGYSESDIKQLMKLGKHGISSLDKSIGKKHSFSEPTRGYTIFYGRDRGESNDMVTTGQYKKVDQYLNDVSNGAGAEWVYLWDEEHKNWLVADIYGDKELMPSSTFESVVNEAIKVEYKRDAKKVVTQYKKIFYKLLPDLGAMSTSSILGCVKYICQEALGDANFHREAEPTAKKIKGKIEALEIKMPGLGGHFVKIGSTTIKSILDKHYSDIANAAGWSGIGIAEGTALFLEELKQEQMGQDVLDAFNAIYAANESVVNEASSDLKVGDSGVDYNDNVVEIIAIGRFAKIAKMFKKETKEDAEDYGIEELTVNTDYYLTKNIESPEGNVGDYSIYPVRYDMANYWGLDPLKESVVNEAKFKKGQNIKSKVDSDDFNGDVYDRTNEVDGSEILKNSSFEIYEIGKDEVVLWSDADQVEYSIDPDDLKNFVKESVVNEAEIKSEEDFKEYAYGILKKAFGEEFDQAKADEVVDGILSKSDGDYGKAAGILQSSLA
tara:strand:+ start:4798 stop:6612 length:1815 start_codon:yes stop_codon:yes gene_type:complete